MVTNNFDMVKAMMAMDNVYASVKDLSKIEFGAVIATTIDQWAVDHDLDAEGACSITRGILEKQPEAWETLGPPEKTTGGVRHED